MSGIPQAEEKMRGRSSRARPTAEIPRLGVNDGVLEIIEEGSIGTATDMGEGAHAQRARDKRLSLSRLVSEVQRLASVLVKVRITYCSSISARLHVSNFLWLLLLSYTHKS